MPDPTEYFVKCEFCSKEISYGVRAEKRMSDVFWNHFLHGCSGYVVRLAMVLEEIMQNRIDTAFREHTSRYKHTDKE